MPNKTMANIKVIRFKKPIFLKIYVKTVLHIVFIINFITLYKKVQIFHWAPSLKAGIEAGKGYCLFVG